MAYMSIIKKVRAVEKIFHTLEKEIAEFKSESGLKCHENCSLCCNKSNIQANSLEFLPLAYYLYKTNQAFSVLEKLEEEKVSSLCMLYNPFNKEGACTNYDYRGLVRRLFGFSATLDKNENKTLVSCRIIKTDQKTIFQQTQVNINKNLHVPLISKYYMKLYAIDLKLASSYYPINEAIKKAIETVLFHFSFRHKRAS